VSWDDASRGTVGDGELSSWGSNITDTRLKARDGTQLFTVRSDNWDEKLGCVSASEILLSAGQTLDHGLGSLQTITLREFLRDGTHGAYAGLEPGCDLSSDTLDACVSIRFQTTFLPIPSSSGGDEQSQDGESGSEIEPRRDRLEIAPEAYNYNMHDVDDPRNLILLCTSQGVAVQQDGVGAQRLFHHAVDPIDGSIHRHWLEAERTEYRVGGAQAESEQERARALARGKASLSLIGIRAMGARCNALMTIQVPLKQQQSRKSRQEQLLISVLDKCGKADELSYDEFGIPDDEPVYRSLGGPSVLPWALPDSRQGSSSAARVSRGSRHDTWRGLTVSHPERDAREHITATVVLYNTVAGGVPTRADVDAAIDDLEKLYAACGASGKRSSEPSLGFSNKPLTFDDMLDCIMKSV
jgi:huntingtin